MALRPKERKIIFMGFRSVGKSSLIIQFVENHFVDNYQPTIQNVFQKKDTFGGQEYHLHLVDTAGEDEYSVVPQSYYLTIDGYVIVYSVTSDKSFQVAQHMYDKLVDMKGGPGSPVLLVGNKTDLRNERVISYDAGKRKADSWKALFLEVSAKENNAVREIFEKIVKLVAAEEDRGLPSKSTCTLS